jgi:ribose-phosphate pyrophosphokinase
MPTESSKDLVLCFPECREQARGMAAVAGMDVAEIGVHHFPDGESRIDLPAALPGRVIIYRSLDRANQKLVELILAAATARDLGASWVTLVAPYLCYMRQDTAFQPGEAVSQRIIGNLLARYFDELLTVDPHLHRVNRIEDAVPLTRARALSATDAMADYLAGRIDNPLLLGPDEESEQWVAALARRNGLEFHVARKQRAGDSEVRITLPDASFKGRHVVLVDDIASTGHTLAVTCRQLARHQPAGITVMVTHALFVGDAVQRILTAGASRIWSCDSIHHATNQITLAETLASALASPGQC